MEYLFLTLLCVVSTTVSGALVLKGCSNAYIHLKCPSDEKVDVKDVQLINAKPSSPCFRPDQLELQASIPDQLSHLCPKDEQCIHVDRCQGKSECVFYISPAMFKNINEGSEIRIEYNCLPGAGRKGGIAVIAIITILLAVALAVTTFFICRTITTGDDDNLTKYDEFENRLSRTPSTASDLPSARYSKNGGTKAESIEISPGASEKSKEAAATGSSEIRPYSASVV